MDRNSFSAGTKCDTTVALRKESVDRNTVYPERSRKMQKSLSARRAWIEIAQSVPALGYRVVALRKESVDRNFDICNPTATLPRSLSARRAWIEIFTSRSASPS